MIVSVVMPVFNGERFVREAIASLLVQTWSDFELIVVDDGSTDRTHEIVESFDDGRIRVVRNATRLGIARALNAGLAAARGEFIARQDADDRSHPARLERQLAFFREHRDVALAGAQVRVIDARGRRSRAPGWRRATTETGIRLQAMFDNPFTHSTVMVRSSVLSEVGGYDERLESAEDFDLWSRIAARHPVRNLADVLLDFRVHGASTAAQYDQTHVARSARVIARNIEAALGDPVPEAWCRALAALHAGVRAPDAAAAREIVTIVTHLADRFLTIHPDARTSRDALSVAAAKLAQTACIAAAHDRRSAIRAFGRAARLDPRAAAAVATRFLPLLVVGERARTLRSFAS